MNQECSSKTEATPLGGLAQILFRERKLLVYSDCVGGVRTDYQKGISKITLETRRTDGSAKHGLDNRSRLES